MPAGGQAHSQYLDFELDIGPGSGDDYPVAVLRSPAGEAREVMRFPFDERQLERFHVALQDDLRHLRHLRPASEGDVEFPVREFGQQLFEALFTGEVRRLYDLSADRARQQGKGLRLKVRIRPPDLAALPWEFLYDLRRADYLALSRSTPLVRYLELAQPPEPLAVAPPLRILGMVAAPSELPGLDVATERRHVEEAAAALHSRGLLELTWLAGQTWRDLQSALQHGPWHAFHFIGHGEFDPTTGEGYLALADERGMTRRLSATELGRLLADHDPMRFVLLNACEGARSSRRDIFSSTAAALIRRGIPAVVAMQYPIGDRAAIEFARSFYQALASGTPVDTAVAEARKAMSLAGAGTFEWGIPALYSRAPDGTLFDLATGAGAAQGSDRSPAPPASGATAPAVSRAELRQLLVTRLSDSELRDLCFDLGVDYESLPAQGKSGKARELIAYCERRDQIGLLLQTCRRLHPEVSWPEGLK